MTKMFHPSPLFLFLILFSIAKTNLAFDQGGSVQIPTRVVVGAPNSPGQFMASFRVGSPAQEFLLVADTGSHQTWMNCNYTCEYCPNRSVALKRERMFQGGLSSSFKVVPCMSEYCETVTSQNACFGSETPSTPCGYQLGYGDGTTTRGIYVNETVTVQADDGDHNEKLLQDVLIGCTASVAGDLGGADGLLGLGNTPHSFANISATKFGNKFSYCWNDIMKPSNNNKTYLNFGKTTLLPNMQYTELSLDRPPYYSLQVKGVSVDGVLLNIPSEAWNSITRQGGLAIDSGLTLMVLLPSAYEPVMEALKAPLMKKFNIVESNYSWGRGTILDFCFNATTGFDELSMVPKIGFHFADGPRFVPPVRNYVVEVESGVRCLAFYRGDQLGIPMNVLGSIMQQGYHWEYNLGSKKLGFAPSTCA